MDDPVTVIHLNFEKFDKDCPSLACLVSTWNKNFIRIDLEKIFISSNKYYFVDMTDNRFLEAIKSLKTDCFRCGMKEDVW